MDQPSGKQILELKNESEDVRRRIRDLFIQTAIFETLRVHGWRLYRPEKLMVGIISYLGLQLARLKEQPLHDFIQIEDVLALLTRCQDQIRQILNAWKSFAIRASDE
jgi:hypothetical protein